MTTLHIKAVTVSFVVILLAAQLFAAQPTARRWAGPNELSEWKRVGYAAGTTPRDAKGIVITVDPNNAPHILRSPMLNIAARGLRGLRIAYTASYVAPGSPVFIVGALDNILDIEQVQGCEITVPVETKGTHVVEADLTISRCWRPDAIIKQIDINVDGAKNAVQPAVVRIHSIELVGP